MSKTQGNYRYEPITEADIHEIYKVMPEVDEEASIDNGCSIPYMLEYMYGVPWKAKYDHLCCVYKWGIIQGQRMERAKLETLAEWTFDSQEASIVARLLSEVEYTPKENIANLGDKLGLRNRLDGWDEDAETH